MQKLNRKIKSEVEENENRMTGSLVNGYRLTLRWLTKEVEDNTSSEDIVINFTPKETKQIESLF